MNKELNEKFKKEVKEVAKSIGAKAIEFNFIKNNRNIYFTEVIIVLNHKTTRTAITLTWLNHNLYSVDGKISLYEISNFNNIKYEWRK